MWKKGENKKEKRGRPTRKQKNNKGDVPGGENWAFGASWHPLELTKWWVLNLRWTLACFVKVRVDSNEGLVWGITWDVAVPSGKLPVALIFKALHHIVERAWPSGMGNKDRTTWLLGPFMARMGEPIHILFCELTHPYVYCETSYDKMVSVKASRFRSNGCNTITSF